MKRENADHQRIIVATPPPGITAFARLSGLRGD
jgi:hypothetical protein